MKLIINAEDLGISLGVNKGIFEGLKQGFITSASLFMNGQYTDEAIKFIKENNIKNVGVHLNLTYGKPILGEKVEKLTEPDGNFRYMCSMPFYAKYEDVVLELDAQIQKFYQASITPSHLDFHHYFYSSNEVYTAYLELAKKYSLPVRSMTEKTKSMAQVNGIKTTDYFIEDFHGGYDISAEQLAQIANRYKNFSGTCELMTTPGYVDQFLATQTNYLAREEELIALKNAFESGVWNDVELISFLDL